MNNDMLLTYVIWAFALGGISAVSLPLGSWLGLAWRPKDWIVGAMAAFGAGALVAALTIELVAPTVMAYAHHQNGDHDGSAAFFFLIGGAVIGGILFVILDQIVNAHGGFLRKTAYTIRYYSNKKRKLQEEFLTDLSSVKVLTFVPKQATQELLQLVRPLIYNIGESIFHEGDAGNELYIIRQGQIEILQEGKLVSTLNKGDVFGEIALLTLSPRNADALCKTHVELLSIHSRDFDQLRKNYPELNEAVSRLAAGRISESEARSEEHHKKGLEWVKSAIASLNSGVFPLSKREFKAMHKSHGGAPLAIWLGILLDGIPESFVIGTGLFAVLTKHAAQGLNVGFNDVIPYTLIAGLFLSNFPEALSSSVGMEDQGMSKSKILWLWISLMLMTAIGASFGFFVGESLSHTVVVGIEGIAAGAMLTMIAAAMLPEASHRGGGNLAGISTLLGFLAAISFKIFE